MAYERWDRDRFEREGGGREYIERERFDERDYYDRGREEVDFREDEYRREYAPPPVRERSRGPPMRESERIFFEDRHTSGVPVPYRPRRDDVRYYDDRETIVDRSGDMVPYREREDDREIDLRFRRTSRPSFSRPQFVRRQSSLDTHDRRPMPRYGDHVREEIVVPVPARRRSPPRYERDYEEIRIAEPDYYGNDDYHPYREREIETVRRRYPPPPPPQPQGEEILYERKEEVIRSEYPKKGKTRMPRRLVNLEAITKLGYEYIEEENTIIVLKALGKENIDEVIRISRQYNTTQILPPPLDQPVPPPVDEEIVTRRTEIIKENPSLASSSSSSSRSSSPTATVVSTRTKKSHKSHASRHTAHSRHSRSTHRSKSSHRRHRSLSASTVSRDLVIREPRYHHHHRDEPISAALIVPNREKRSLEDEIRALELERRALQLERDAERTRKGHDVIVEKEYKDGSIEVKKDRNGKMSLIRNP